MCCAHLEDVTDGVGYDEAASDADEDGRPPLVPGGALGFLRAALGRIARIDAQADEHPPNDAERCDVAGCPHTVRDRAGGPREEGYHQRGPTSRTNESRHRQDHRGDGNAHRPLLLGRFRIAH
jgi:hypothetical protein